MAVYARDFYPDVAELSMNVHGFAGERAALRAISPRAEGRCLCKNQIHQRWRVLRAAKKRKQRSRAILFHLHGSCVNVERAGGQSFFLKVSVDLRIHVVEIDFDDGDFFVETGNSFFHSFADHDAQNVRLTFDVGGACTVTDR